MTAPFKLIPIKEVDDIWGIPEIETMYSAFDSSPNISKEILVHLLNGKPVIDLSDGEYIHFFQLDNEAVQFIKEKYCF